MDRAQAEDYANRWITAFNRLDIEEVLSTFAEDVSFSSPRAMEGLGVSTVHGKQAMRDYWSAGLSRIQNLRFKLVRTIWDGDRLELVIILRQRSEWTTRTSRREHAIRPRRPGCER